MASLTDVDYDELGVGRTRSSMKEQWAGLGRIVEDPGRRL